MAGVSATKSFSRLCIGRSGLKRARRVSQLFQLPGVRVGTDLRGSSAAFFGSVTGVLGVGQGLQGLLLLPESDEAGILFEGVPCIIVTDDHSDGPDQSSDGEGSCYGEQFPRASLGFVGLRAKRVEAHPYHADGATDLASFSCRDWTVPIAGSLSGGLPFASGVGAK